MNIYYLHKSQPSPVYLFLCPFTTYKFPKAAWKNRYHLSPFTDIPQTGYTQSLGGAQR